MRTPGWAKRPGSQTVTSFLSRKNIPVSRRSTPLTSLRDSVSRRQEERRHQAIRKEKTTQHRRGSVGTPTRAVASTFQSHTSTRAVACTVKKKNRSFSSVTVSLNVDVTVEKQRSAPGSAAPELQRSGAPGAPDQDNIATRFGPNGDGWKKTSTQQVWR